MRRSASSGGGDTVTVLGITFKENVSDIRNSRAVDVVSELRAFGLTVQVADPLTVSSDCEHEYGFPLVPQSRLTPADAVILAVPRRPYLDGGWPLMQPLLKNKARLVIDVKSALDRGLMPECLDLWRT